MEQEHVRRGFRIHPEASFLPLWFAGGGEVLRRNRSGPDVSRAYPLLDESSVTTKSP